MKIRFALTWTLVCLAPLTAAAQIDSSERRRVLFGDVGYARTWDDEGLLGQGASLSGGIGFSLTPRFAVQAIIQRIPYYRDVEWLTFDGRVLFVGAEAAFQSTKSTVRPFATAGIGMFNDDGVWIRKTTVSPTLPRVEERVKRTYTLSALTASGGIDFSISGRTSIRTSLRFHGLLDTGDDLAPHIIIQPGVGIIWRW
jgi:hypothetical protein